VGAPLKHEPLWQILGGGFWGREPFRPALYSSPHGARLQTTPGAEGAPLHSRGHAPAKVGGGGGAIYMVGNEGIAEAPRCLRC